MRQIDGFFELSDYILDLSPHGDLRNYWTLDDATKGVQIFGGTGSGINFLDYHWNHK